MTMFEKRQPSNIMITDKDFLIRHYRIMLDILEAVKLGYAPREELDNAIDNYIRFKLPTKFTDRIRSSADLDIKYRNPKRGELVSIDMRYQTSEDRNREKSKIENEIRFNVDLDILDDIKKLLEDETIMNQFDTTKKVPQPPPVTKK